ncbi:MAG: hypothetical protein IPG94_18485 [Kineosporiaceae bacterium]|nr:hypothetical protein [Kineosporiaceae bacterium]
MTRVHDLRDELARLRAGAGLQAPRLRRKLGPELWAACGVQASDNEATTRAKVTTRLEALVPGLTPVDALAVRVALNLESQYASRFFQERMDSLGRAIDRERRTAVRRVDDALNLLAEMLDRSAAARPRVPTAGDPAKSGWYIADFRAEALVSAELVVVDDFITVVATVDELDRLFTWWAAAPSEDDTSQVSVEVLSGGTLSPDERLTRAGVWSGELVLATPLQAGESLDLHIRVGFTGPLERSFQYYPDRRVDRFEVQVRVDDSCGPIRAWLVDHEVMALVEDVSVPRPELAVHDGGRRASAVFEQLDLGLAHGIRWDFIED